MVSPTATPPVTTGTAAAAPRVSRRVRRAPLSVLTGGSLPRQEALACGIEHRQLHDGHEQEHACESAQQDILEDERPQRDEDDLDVEGHEQERVEVEREAEAPSRVAVGIDARLIGQALVAV